MLKRFLNAIKLSQVMTSLAATFDKNNGNRYSCKHWGARLSTNYSPSRVHASSKMADNVRGVCFGWRFVPQRMMGYLFPSALVFHWSNLKSPLSLLKLSFQKTSFCKIVLTFWNSGYPQGHFVFKNRWPVYQHRERTHGVPGRVVSLQWQVFAGNR